MKRGLSLFVLIVFVFAGILSLSLVSAQCADSDGKDFYTAGSVVDGNYSFTDSCVDGKTVKEGLCDGEKALETTYACPNGCQDGACLPIICSAMPTCTGAKDTGQKDSDGCPIYSCQTTPVCEPTKCGDGIVYECNIDNNQCVCPSCPIQTCRDSDGGKDYYVRGEVKNDKGGAEDYCWSPNAGKISEGPYVIEYSCSKSGEIFKEEVAYYCPDGCQNGACIQKAEEVKEQVKCLFVGANQEQKCYTAYDNSRAACPGVEGCIAYILGYKGEQITWKSSCGGYAYTTMDGNNEYAKFDCSGKISCTDSDDGRNIYRKGITTGLDWSSEKTTSETDYCVSDGEKSGRLAEYYCDYIDGVFRVRSETFGPEDGCYGCSDGACQQIIVKPVCGNEICESGEGEVCAISDMSIQCREGKECKTPSATCSVACPQDCKKTEGIYAKINEKFKLQVYQPAKIVENENHLMKISFKDLIAYKCKEVETSSVETKKIEERAVAAEASITGRAVSEASSAGGGGGGVAVQPTPVEIMKCIGAGPKALLDIDMIVNGELGKHMIINLDVGEKKQIGDLTVSFLGYDYASRTGAFLVGRETFSCPDKCKCDENGKIIECATETCEEGKTLCTDGKCREKCEIISEDCNFGCLHEGKCFPMSVRSKGLYCSTDLIMNSQLEADETCENNFECKSNVCVAGKCISESFINKIINWFKRIFGGG